MTRLFAFILAACLIAPGSVDALTFVDTTTAQTLSNKTFTSPTISGATFTGTFNIGESATLEFEGATTDANETTFAFTDPTGDRTITFPDDSGTIIFADNANTWSAVQTFTADPIIGGTTPQLTIGDAGIEDTSLVYDGNAEDYYIGQDDTDDQLKIGLGSTVGTTEQLSFGTGTIVVNEDSADYNFRVEGANNANLFVLDAGQDAISLGGANVDGAAFILNNLTDRTAVTSVGTQFHTPTQIQNFDNVSGTIAIGATHVFGIPTQTNDNATLTMTNAVNVYIAGAPAASTNVTHTTAGYGLWAAGTTRLDGEVQILADSTSLVLGAGQDVDIYYSGTDLYIEPQTVGSGNVIINDPAILFINDTANANMTVGETINQSTNDDLIFGLKGGVATVLTTIVLGNDVETDDFFTIEQRTDDTGGVHIQVLGETTLTETFIMDIWGGSPATTSTSASLAAANWFVGEHDGANADVDMAADSNGFAWGEISSAGARLTRMLLEVDTGELHLGNGTVATLDHYEDVKLVRAYVRSFSTGVGMIESRWEDYRYTRADLVTAGVISTTGDDALMSVQGMMNLQNGALWQLYTSQQDAMGTMRRYASRIVQLERQVMVLVKRIEKEKSDVPSVFYAGCTVEFARTSWGQVYATC